MIILLVGSGAREHALARALSQDPAVTALHAVPGNPGIGQLATLHAGDQNDGSAVAALAAELGADLVVVGPEAPLVAGVADAVRAAGIPVFGPSGEAAMLEGSKAFAKDVMAAAKVPTAASRTCTTASELTSALHEFGAPHVVKDDGLAAGKGVVVTSDFDEAIAHGEAILSAGGTVVVEDFLDGPEVSLFCLCDGSTVIPLQPAQDFKRAYDADAGPNTGGMGAYSPLPWAPPGLVADVVQHVAQPTIDEMARRGTPFVGVLYCGPRGYVQGRARDRVQRALWRPRDSSGARPAPNAARGCAPCRGGRAPRGAHGPALERRRSGHRRDRCQRLPGEPRQRRPHHGRRRCGGSRRRTRAPRWHGRRRSRLVSSGGRVLSVVGTGPGLAAARDRAYAGVAQISLPGSHHRSDIAQKAAEAVS